jgi:hypothetical protein
MKSDVLNVFIVIDQKKKIYIIMLLCKVLFQLNVSFYKPVNSGKMKADSVIMGSKARQGPRHSSSG